MFCCAELKQRAVFWKKSPHTGKKIALLPTCIDNPNMENNPLTTHNMCKTFFFNTNRYNY